MFKKVLMFVAISSAVIAVNSGLVSAQVVPDPDKVTICHATNSVSNPYTRPTVNDDAADGNTTNDKGQGDHSTHTGPVATSPQVAQELKNSKQDWGDIIPPHDNYAGLNWTAEGQAIYNNNCEYVDPDFDEPLVTVDVTCPQIQGGKVVVTLNNAGLVAGTATVNGQIVNVPAGANVVLEFDQGVNIEVVIEQQTAYNQIPVCTGGRGGDTPVVTTSTPAAPTVTQVDAPKAGVSAGTGSSIALSALLATSVASIAFGIIRLRKVSR